MSRTAIATIVAALFIYTSAAAQGSGIHEISVSAGAGITSLQTRPATGSSKGKLSGTIGAGYHYALNEQWGIRSGLGIAFYGGSFSIADYDRQQTATNTETGHAFSFMVTSAAYSEKQRVALLTIPLMAQYRYTGIEKLILYGAGGVKVGIPVAASTSTQGTYTTKGYYPDLNVTYEDLPYGFVTGQPFPEGKTALAMKPAIMLSLEAGTQWPLSGNTSLYLGLYLDMGLNNALKRSAPAASNLVTYQPDTPLQLMHHAATDLYAGKVAPIAFGITARYAFTLGKSAE